MSILNLKGLWIPIEVLTDKNLSDKEKHIYSLIIFLSQEKQYCFCTNKTISELLNISVTQVSKLVNSLKDKGYINIEMVYKENSKEVDIRKLIPIEEKLNTLFNKSLSIKIYLLYFYGKTKNAVKLFLVFWGAGTPATLTLFSNSVKKVL